ncbi:hypothetical protein LINPERHAP1_LOCUS34627 [Linum perenne]
MQVEVTLNNDFEQGGANPDHEELIRLLQDGDRQPWMHV